MHRLGLLGFILLAACGNTQPDGTPQPELRAAVDRASYDLGTYVTLAQASVPYSAGINARIDRTADQFAVGAIANVQRQDIRLDFLGNIVFSAPAGTAGAGCRTQISLSEALAIAEAEVGGDAVAVTPDDDDSCMREIQILVGLTLWEVKVGPAGAVLESELSDEEL